MAAETASEYRTGLQATASGGPGPPGSRTHLPALRQDPPPATPPPDAQPASWRRPAWVAAVLGAWTLNGIASASQYYFVRSSAGEAIAWPDALRPGLASAYLWIPVTVVALWLTWRVPVEREAWLPRLLLHLCVALGVPVFRAAAVVVLNPWIRWYPELPPFSTVLLSNLANSFFFYLLLLGFVHALHFAEQARQREKVAERLRTELVQAQLHTLRAQLQPHFLFNTLNAISALVQQDPEAAERMIARLSNLLRHTLERAAAQEVDLREELDFVESYLEIEQARFEDRLRVRWAVDPATLEARVPPLILQPLVENAIRHGIVPRSEPGTVEITSGRRNGSLVLRVRDDGVGLVAPGAAARDGVGIRSVRTRLEQLYGRRHSFALEAAPGGGVLAELSLPFETTNRRRSD
jgi:two-component system, LytTR family, sensor kinase